MTKRVRIENADSSHHPIRIRVYEKRPEGDKLVSDTNLVNPTDMAECYVYGSQRYIVVDELPLN